MSKTITAVKTSPHPTASPNPAGGEEKMSATRTALSGQREAEAGRAAVGEALLREPGASDQGASHSLSLSVSVSLPLLCFSDRRMSGPGAWCLVMISPSRLCESQQTDRQRERAEEERHRLHLAASASPLFCSPAASDSHDLAPVLWQAIIVSM